MDKEILSSAVTDPLGPGKVLHIFSNSIIATRHLYAKNDLAQIYFFSERQSTTENNARRSTTRGRKTGLRNSKNRCILFSGIYQAPASRRNKSALIATLRPHFYCVNRGDTFVSNTNLAKWNTNQRFSLSASCTTLERSIPGSLVWIR